MANEFFDGMTVGGTTYEAVDTGARQLIEGKVDKETGKGLSTNDYTTTEKNKLAGIASGATANIGTITGITMNGSSMGTSGIVNLGTVITEHQDISGKADKIAVETDLNHVQRSDASIPNSYLLNPDVFYNIANWNRDTNQSIGMTFGFNRAAGAYAGRFTAWANNMNLTWPTGVDVVDADSLEITSGHTYEFNVWLGKCIIKDVTGGE